MKILILALSGIGDALMFTPAMKLMRDHFPDAQIDAVVMYKGVFDIYRRTGICDAVTYHNFLSESPLTSLKFVLGLRGKYDCSFSVYPANRREYNGIQFLAGAKKRGAVKYKRMNASNLGFLNNVTVDEDDSLHNVTENVRMVEKMFGVSFETVPPLQFPLTTADKSFATDFIENSVMEYSGALVGFHPGCATLKNHIMRRWEPEKFSELGKKLVDQGNTVLIFGGPEEEELKYQVYKGIDHPSAFVVNSKNLGETAALMKQCDVFVTNDSSLMHTASAMQIPVVAIIGPTNPAYIHPWQTRYELVSLHLDCAPCFFYSPKPLSCTRTDVPYKCRKEITVDMVLSAVKKILTATA